MARSKAIRVEKPLATRRQPRSDLCTMSTVRRPPSPKTKKWKKAMGSNPLTEPEEVAAHLTKPEAPGPLTKPKVPAPPRRSEVTPSQMQPDVIDLTGED